MVRPTIAMVGSNMMDLITYYEDNLPRIGETIFGKDFEIGFGGKGANQAVAASRLGAEVEIVTAVGDDLFGPLVIENFRKYDINTDFIKTVEGRSSGVAPIFVDQGGRNSIFIIPGANSHLEAEDVTKARNSLSRASFLLLQLEIQLETVYFSIDLARELGLKVILNPAPGRKLEWEKIRNLFLLVPNETELETITGVTVRTTEDIKKGISLLMERGVENVLVTLGEKGALLATGGGFADFPAYRVEAVDTTGAGDAFLGALATFLGEGKTLEESIDGACAYAALSTTRRGTQKSFAGREEFEEWYFQKKAGKGR